MVQTLTNKTPQGVLYVLTTAGAKPAVLSRCRGGLANTWSAQDVFIRADLVIREGSVNPLRVFLYIIYLDYF